MAFFVVFSKKTPTNKKKTKNEKQAQKYNKPQRLRSKQGDIQFALTPDQIVKAIDAFKADGMCLICVHTYVCLRVHTYAYIKP